MSFSCGFVDRFFCFFKPSHDRYGPRINTNRLFSSDQGVNGMRGLNSISRLIVSFLILALGHSPAGAQWRGGPMREFNFNNPMSALAATMVLNKAREETLAKSLGVNPRAERSAGNRSATGIQPQPAPVKMDQSVLRFQSTGTYLKTKELADQMSTDPAQRETCLKIMNGMLDAFGQKTQQLGLQNDVAAALAFFFGENIRIYRGAPELPDQQYVGLRNMIASALTAGDGFAQATDRQKQEMYEILVAATGFTQFAYEQAIQVNRSDVAKTYQQVAGSNLQSLTKVSPDSINLTSDGLTLSAANDSSAPLQPTETNLNGVSGNPTRREGVGIMHSISFRDPFHPTPSCENPECFWVLTRNRG